MLLDTRLNEKFKEISITENELQYLIVENFNIIFPSLIYLQNEFEIKGDVRQFGMSGRIDILAYDPSETCFVIIELKKNHSNNILIQALDYSDFITENIELLTLRIQKFDIKEKKKILKHRNKPKIILIAKSFVHPTLRRSEKISEKVKLYEYSYYSNGFLLLNSVISNVVKPKINFPERQITDDKFELDIINTIKDVINNRFVDEKFYLIENNILTINPSKLYYAYKAYCIDNKLSYLNYGVFFKKIKAKKEYVRNVNSKRFKNINTSVIEIKMN